jgi:hypothetical protein
MPINPTIQTRTRYNCHADPSFIIIYIVFYISGKNSFAIFGLEKYCNGNTVVYGIEFWLDRVLNCQMATDIFTDKTRNQSCETIYQLMPNLVQVPVIRHPWSLLSQWAEKFKARMTSYWSEVWIMLEAVRCSNGRKLYDEQTHRLRIRNIACRRILMRLVCTSRPASALVGRNRDWPLDWAQMRWRFA